MEKMYKTVYSIALINFVCAILGKFLNVFKQEWLVYSMMIVLGLTLVSLVINYIYYILKFKKVDHMFFCSFIILVFSIDVGLLHRLLPIPYGICLMLLIINIIICLGIGIYNYLKYKKEGKNNNEKTLFPFVQNSHEDFLILMYLCSICILSTIM